MHSILLSHCRAFQDAGGRNCFTNKGPEAACGGDRDAPATKVRYLEPGSNRRPFACGANDIATNPSRPCLLCWFKVLRF